MRIVIYICLLINGCQKMESSNFKNNHTFVTIIKGNLLPQNALSGIENSVNRWRILLYKNEPKEHLFYSIEGASETLRIDSGRYESDGCDIAVNQGQGLVIHVHPAGDRILINEWENSAVCESSPIYVEFDRKKNPVVKHYNVISLSGDGDTDGLTEHFTFKGWSKSKLPIVEEVYR